MCVSIAPTFQRPSNKFNCEACQKLSCVKMSLSVLSVCWICNFQVRYLLLRDAGLWGPELREAKEKLAKMRTKDDLIPSFTLLILVQFFNFVYFSTPNP